MTTSVNNKTTKAVAVVIVTFNPIIPNLLSIVQTLGDAYHVIVIDNGSANAGIWHKNICFLQNIELVALQSNVGIAKAQNIGIRLALEKKSNFLFFLDQDSQIDQELLPILLNSFESMSHKHNVAAVGPSLVDPIKNCTHPIICLDKHGFKKKIPSGNAKTLIEASVLISSGSLISSEALQNVGLMNEAFFIDFVDTEWFFRAADKDYHFYVNPAAVMLHSVGTDSIQFFKWTIPIHSGERKYYRVRNSIKMLSLPYIPIYLRLRLVLVTISQQIILILTQPRKKSYISSLLTGIKDGLFNKY